MENVKKIKINKAGLSSGLKKENRVIKIIAHIVMIIASLLAVFPFLLMISSSITSEEALAKYGYGFIPGEVSFEAYAYLFKAWPTIGKAYLITILSTLVGTLLHMLITTMLAFGLAWKKMPGRKIVMFLLVFTMLFNGGAAATYIVYSSIFHLDNTFFALIVPGLLMTAFGVMLFVMYFRSSIGYWNDWNNSLYYISMDHQELYSIQRLLKEMQDSVDFIASNPDLGLSTENLPSASVQMAIAIIGIVPILIAYPFFQKGFVAGISLGGVKE